jgi:type VI secretion system protein ImpM
MDSAWGWYGKLPAIGDFASRRLPHGFVEPWDAWLAQGLARWRDDDPDWLAAYLAGPIWSFRIGPRVLSPGRDGSAWAGILMPSVDRVGRYFPLTVAAPVGSGSVPRLVHRLQHTARVAAEAMHADWTAAELDAALLALDDLTVPPWIDDDGGATIALTQALQDPAAPARSLWWPADGALLPLHQHQGLPGGADFARLLGATA